MATDRPATHLELLEAARTVQRLAAGGDTDGLHGEVCRLRNALVTHVQHERAADDADTKGSQLIQRGQSRLVDFIDELLTSTAEHGPDDACSCLLRAAELRARLLRQVSLEHHLARAADAAGPRS